MTYENKIYELHLEFLKRYTSYSEAAITIARKLSQFEEVPFEEHKNREKLYDEFLSAFTTHRKLQQHVMDNKLDIKSLYKE